MKKVLSLLLIPFLCGGCASFYNPVQPNTLRYSFSEIGKNISYSYKFDVLSDAGNRKYAKKEKKHDIDIVSVKNHKYL